MMMKRAVINDLSDQPALEGPATGGGAEPSPLAISADDFDRDVWCVLGLPIDCVTLAEAVLRVETSARDRRRLNFVTPNVNILVRSLRDPDARRQILDADLSLADGAPVVALARLLGAPLRERAAGSDLFEALRQRPGFHGRRLKVFFFGGRDGAGEAACHRLNADRGGVECVGWLNPGFGDVASMSGPDVIDAINQASPDFVVVALGAAKGHEWIYRNFNRLQAPVIAHLGAVIDFTAGKIRRAPGWVARIGFEWAWRIFAEPALWRRYAFDAVRLAVIGWARLGAQLSAGRPVGAPAAVAVARDRNGRCVIELGGDLCRESLAPVRDAFRQAVRAGTDVTLRFSAKSSVDRAFLGQVLMLEKLLARRGLGIAACGMNRRVRALFSANMMNYAEPDPTEVERVGVAARAG
jgi:N-acetylglucosaminyldiphosphoundecaprenol N-acetyl-beta-D-mannosaminyltransferase